VGLPLGISRIIEASSGRIHIRRRRDSGRREIMIGATSTTKVEGGLCSRISAGRIQCGMPHRIGGETSATTIALAVGILERYVMFLSAPWPLILVSE
jgi:hypothetical protein